MLFADTTLFSYGVSPTVPKLYLNNFNTPFSYSWGFYGRDGRLYGGGDAPVSNGPGMSYRQVFVFDRQFFSDFGLQTIETGYLQLGCGLNSCLGEGDSPVIYTLHLLGSSTNYELPAFSEATYLSIGAAPIIDAETVAFTGVFGSYRTFDPVRFDLNQATVAFLNKNTDRFFIFGTSIDSVPHCVPEPIETFLLATTVVALSSARASRRQRS